MDMPKVYFLSSLFLFVSIYFTEYIEYICCKKVSFTIPESIPFTNVLVSQKNMVSSYKLGSVIRRALLQRMIFHIKNKTRDRDLINT